MPDGTTQSSSMSGALEGDEERPAVQVYEELLQLHQRATNAVQGQAHTVIHPTDRYGKTAAKGGRANYGAKANSVGEPQI